ncbi:hypothetical protein M1555_04015 [Patescibacteria group bacterium]|nr:hypothetical protein [Patescibacteria group bacterium]
MNITICGSMQFHREMIAAKATLEKAGHLVVIPSGAYHDELNESYMTTDEEKINVKIEHDFIREHFRAIQGADAIVVLNYEKNGIAGYIGGNTFLEMGIAFWLGKKIFLLYPVPKMDYLTEMHAMQPVILDGDLTTIAAETRAAV